MKVLVLAEPKKAAGFKAIGIEAPKVTNEEECKKLLLSIKEEEYVFFLIQKEWSHLIKSEERKVEI